MPTKTETKPVTFYSRRSGLRLVRKPKTPRIANDGTVFLTDNVVYEFKDGVLVVSPGEDVLNDGPGGEPQDKLAWLRGHSAYQDTDGFHEAGAEPDRIPDPTPELQAIAAAAAKGDLEGLMDVLEAERDGHGRQVVLDAGVAAMDVLSPPAGEGEPPEAA